MIWAKPNSPKAMEDNNRLTASPGVIEIDGVTFGILVKALLYRA